MQALAKQVCTGKQNRTFVVALSPIVSVPAELEKHFVVLDHDLPARSLLACGVGERSANRVVMPAHVVERFCLCFLVQAELELEPRTTFRPSRAFQTDNIDDG